VEHYAAIDVSLELSSECMVDGTGKIIRETKVASEPEALAALFKRHQPRVHSDRSRNGPAVAVAARWTDGGGASPGRNTRPQLPWCTRRSQAELVAIVAKKARQ
jgi:hypothetical protein